MVEVLKKGHARLLIFPLLVGLCLVESRFFASPLSSLFEDDAADFFSHFVSHLFSPLLSFFFFTRSLTELFLIPRWGSSSPFSFLRTTGLKVMVFQPSHVLSPPPLRVPPPP